MDDDRYTRITLRLPTELHAKLQKASEQSSHSMNAEIIARIERAFETEHPTRLGDMDQFADTVAERVAAKLRMR